MTLDLSPQSQQVYNTALALLTNDSDGDRERLLWEIVNFEENPPKREYPVPGFEWYEVHGDPRTLNSLVTRGILNIIFKSNKSCSYETADREAIKRALNDYRGLIQPPEEEEYVPPDLFDIIIGHEGKRELIMRSISADEPVHFLLWGVPASAKSLMLEELNRLPRSKFVLGSNLSKAGLYDVLLNEKEKPRFLIVDELDKIDDQSNLAGLLSLMERGIITETKYKRHRQIKLKCWVFASANEIRRIPKELMSRFLLLKFKPYGDAEFIDVAVNVLTKREGSNESLALYISQKVMEGLGSRDVRDAVKVARLLKGDTKAEVDHILGILRNQR
jgi:Holliday junction DNA helicase RuvB